ncbi:MAG: DUF6291 domain-containing protein [Flavobacteriaceae bacterium]|jgi:hypothetical protein|nr:DUF6291 domain-containing protein [Flavobacteriaceae bacterium]
MENNIKGFSFYKSYWSAIQALTNENSRKELTYAIIKYAFSGEYSCDNDVVSMGMELIKPSIDISIKRSESGSFKTPEKSNPNQNGNKPKSNPNQNGNYNTTTTTKNNKLKEVVVDVDVDVDVGEKKFSEMETKEILLKKEISIDRWAVKNKVLPDRIRECINEFAEYKERIGENSKWKNETDLIKNFEFWLKTNAKEPVSDSEKSENFQKPIKAIVVGGKRIPISEIGKINPYKK